MRVFVCVRVNARVAVDVEDTVGAMGGKGEFVTGNVGVICAMLVGVGAELQPIAIAAMSASQANMMVFSKRTNAD